MPPQNPWRKVSTRVVYENPWITVREDQVIRPDGHPGIYGVVQTRPATGVMALTATNAIYLVGQYRYTLETYSWEIVEGGGDPGEEPLAAAKRELREEAGLVADHWAPLGPPLSLSNCHSDERAWLYVARGLRDVGAQPEGTEDLQVQVVPFAEALAMVDRGEIHDAVSVLAILRYVRQFRGHAAE
ncbi:MAG: NUDIX domain-containing protein [Candidatus Hydrogenedentota bacterium]